jgi:hypothetical protein
MAIIFPNHVQFLSVGKLETHRWKKKKTSFIYKIVIPKTMNFNMLHISLHQYQLYMDAESHYLQQLF